MYDGVLRKSSDCTGSSLYSYDTPQKVGCCTLKSVLFKHVWLQRPLNPVSASLATLKALV